MKSELLVIADQHAAVNAFPSFHRKTENISHRIATARCARARLPPSPAASGPRGRPAYLESRIASPDADTASGESEIRFDSDIDRVKNGYRFCDMYTD